MRMVDFALVAHSDRMLISSASCSEAARARAFSGFALFGWLSIVLIHVLGASPHAVFGGAVSRAGDFVLLIFFRLT